MFVSWSVSNWDLGSYLLRKSRLGYLPQGALTSWCLSQGREGSGCLRECACKTRGQTVGLTPTPPSCCQQERKMRKVKTISSRICKLSHSVGKQTLKIVTRGRPTSRHSSLPNLPCCPGHLCNSSYTALFSKPC